MNHKTQLSLRSAILGSALFCTSTLLAQTHVGQWDFNSGTLAGTSGGDLTYAGDAQTGTQFGSTTALGLPDVNGSPAQVMGFPAAINGSGYWMPTHPTPTGAAQP
jgi:hypothetical protein